MFGWVYLFLNRTGGKLSRLLNSCSNGFWMGVLSKKDCHLIDEIRCNRSQQWVSEVHNSGGLFGWENEAVNKYFKDCKRIMVIAAGGGREVLALHKAGYSVDGFECNRRLVEFADKFFESKKIDTRIKPITRDHAPNNGEIYDGAIIGWGAYMLILGRENRIQLIKELRRQLKEDAPILLSFFVRSKAENTRYEKVTINIANIIRRCFFRGPLEEGDRLDSTLRHLFTRGEIAEELSEGGFKLIEFNQSEYPHAVGIAQNGRL